MISTASQSRPPPHEVTEENVETGAPTRTRDQVQADISNWLPITAARTGKSWHSTFHNVTALVGAGVLGLPYAVSQLGWVAGMGAILTSWTVTFYTLWQLVHLHEVVPGRRFDRYRELGQHAFGPKLGFWVVMPQQLIVQVACDIVYMVTGGKSLKKFIDLVLPTAASIRQTFHIVIFACVHLALSQIPDFNSLKGISTIAALMSVCYSMISFVTSIIKGLHQHRSVDYSLRARTTPGRVFNILNALGTIAFAFAGHSVVLEIQATIPSTETKPSRKPMWKGITYAYFIVAFCYLSVAASGYWAFGNAVDDDVLISLQNPGWLIATANLMVFIHVLGSYQVFAMPVFDLLESNLPKIFNFTPGIRLRLLARSTYVVLTALIAMCIPFFGGLLGFFGGLVFASTSYILPCAIWLCIHRPKWGSFHWLASWFCLTLGISIALLAPIGGLHQIIVSMKTYKMFS